MGRGGPDILRALIVPEAWASTADIPTKKKRTCTVTYYNEEKTTSRGRVQASHYVSVGEMRQ